MNKSLSPKDYIIVGLVLTIVVLVIAFVQTRAAPTMSASSETAVIEPAATDVVANAPTQAAPAPTLAAADAEAPTEPAEEAIAGGFSETFDGDPANPTRWNPQNWDVTIHTREATDTFDTMEASHDLACDAPPTTHTINRYEDAVYLCRNHVMTAISASDYGVIYLTPDHMVDFSDGEAVVRFDLSTLRLSQRDWVDVWITPYDDNLQLPLEDWLPDLSGEPRRAVQVRMDNAGEQANFRVGVIRDFENVLLESQEWAGYESVLEPDAKRRDTFELRISRTHVKFGMPDYNFWWVDTPIDDLGWDVGVVQFGHHSYNPTKDCADCTASTWHWDNVSIAPAQPFTMLRADRSYVDPTTAPGVTFPAGAPADTHLRFAGIGNNLEVSFDGGATWQAAQLQAQEAYFEDHFRSYWMPIPSGVSSVQFRGTEKGDGWYEGPWMVRDVAIWSQVVAPSAQ